MAISFAEIVGRVRAAAEEAIRKVDIESIVGPEKLERAADLIADQVDEAIRLPAFLEPFDGAIVKAIAKFAIQLVFDELRARGSI